MRKRGFELSFNFILSVLTIAFIVAVAMYAIIHFLSLQNCAQLGLFQQELQREVDKAWNSEIARSTFSGTIPTGIESVCIGNVSYGGGLEEYPSLRKYLRENYLLFFYPTENACDQAAYPLAHIDTATRSSFRCYDVEGGKVSFTITKSGAASLVSITP